ncbi:integrase family protein [Desulfopila sp. IMCC35008]|uniref:tyrosine-type recombinase/integrase n=1 Tax=Desulfopila sp. IMCC35008 TaxID=2653858 RepID=UPI0013D3A05B|nr:integrase family protein [Desulfopila sp. IMCC35008]
MALRINLTKSTVDKLPFAEKGKQKDYYDEDVRSFGVRVSHTAKTYFVRKRINGKHSRVTIGKHGIITADKARKEARLALSDITRGVDLNQEKAIKMVKGMTLGEAYDDYLAAKPQMKQKTIAVDKSLIKCHLSAWLKKPIKDITESMIQRRHLQIAKSSGENTANNAMRLFRRIYLFAWRSNKKSGMLDRDLIKDALDGRWFKVGRRQTVLQAHELSPWYKAVQKVSNPVIRDYFMLLLFTGLRETEAKTLQWCDVDFEGKTFIIRKEISKNKEELILPMSNVVYEILKQRHELQENNFVFPGTGKTGHIVNTKKQIAFVQRESQKILNGVDSDDEFEEMLKQKSVDQLKPGISFCHHDLRRTYISIAEGEVSYSVLKRLVNHKDKDVTQGYIVMSVERLRLPMQQITNAITALFEEPKETNVVPIESGRKKVVAG